MTTTFDDGYKAGYAAARRHYGTRPRASLLTIRRAARQAAESTSGRIPPAWAELAATINNETENL